MISYIMKKIIGSQNDREIKRLAALVDRVNEYESEFPIDSQQSDLR